MSETILRFGDIRVENSEFRCSEYPIHINNVKTK